MTKSIKKTQLIIKKNQPITDTINMYIHSFGTFISKEEKSMHNDIDTKNHLC